MELIMQNPLSEIAAYKGKPLDLPMWLHDPAGFSAQAQGKIAESAWAKLQGPQVADRSRSCPGSRPGSRNGSNQRGQASIAVGNAAANAGGFSLDRLSNRLGMAPQDREAEMRRLLRHDVNYELGQDSPEVVQQSQGRRASSLPNGRPRSGSNRMGSGRQTPQSIARSHASPEPPTSGSIVCAVCGVAVASKAEMRDLPCGHCVHWRCLNQASSKGCCPVCNPGRRAPVSPQAKTSSPARPSSGGRDLVRDHFDATIRRPRSVMAATPVLSDAFANPPHLLGRPRSVVDEDAPGAVFGGTFVDLVQPKRPRSVVDENATATIVGSVSDSLPPRRPSRLGLPVPPPVEVHLESAKDIEEVSAENAAKALLAGLPKPQDNKPDWRVKAGDNHAMRAGKPRSTLRALAEAATT